MDNLNQQIAESGQKWETDKSLFFSLSVGDGLATEFAYILEDFSSITIYSSDLFIFSNPVLSFTRNFPLQTFCPYCKHLPPAIWLHLKLMAQSS